MTDCVCLSVLGHVWRHRGLSHMCSYVARRHARGISVSSPSRVEPNGHWMSSVTMS